MRPETVRSVPAWRRWALHVLINVGGVVALVGSGGGLPDTSPCQALNCNADPLPPLPWVELQPPYVTAQVGTPVAITAVVTNHSAPSYRWRRSDDGGQTYTDIPGATGATLTLPSVSLADDGVRLQVVVPRIPLTSESVALLAVSSAPGVVFSDGEFLDSDWTYAPVRGPAPPPAAHSAERVAVGGQPGAYRRMVLQLAAGEGSARVGYLSNTAVYDPALQGAVYRIDHAQDCIALPASEFIFTDTSLLLAQGTRVFSSVVRFNTPSCKAGNWAAVTRQASLAASDFVLVDGPACPAGQACPDFSVGAPPLRLGYARQTYGSPGAMAAHGIDNWKVTVWRR